MAELEITCATCNGTGQVESITWHGLMGCTDCDGTGRRTPPPPPTPMRVRDAALFVLPAAAAVYGFFSFWKIQKPENQTAGVFVVSILLGAVPLLLIGIVAQLAILGSLNWAWSKFTHRRSASN